MRDLKNMQLNNKNIVRTALFAVLVSALGYSFAAKSETKLIPFQGKLTDASGQVISDGAIVVQFKMYDAPVGGQAKWNGEVQMLSVNGGLVNTTLGTKASLKNVDFSSPTYLEITIDANGDNEIGPEDPPLLPRQSIIPAVYAVEAGNSKTMGGHDWSAVFSNGDPETGKINGAKLADKSINTAQIANNAVTANQVANGAITSAKLSKNSVTTDKLGSGVVTSDQLAENAVTTDKIAEKSITTELMGERKMVYASETAAPIGSIARSKDMMDFVSDGYTISGNVGLQPNFVQIPGLSLKLKTSGRPVMIMLQRGHFDIYGYAEVRLWRDDISIDWHGLAHNSNKEDVTTSVSTPLTFIDTPPAGEHQYSLQIGNRNSSASHFSFYGNPYLIAFEL